MWKLKWLALCILAAHCAHKAPPLSKDRMSPKLLKVAALNNRQIQFTFSEILDTLNLKPEYFNITSGPDTLKIMHLYPSLSAAEIIAITENQLDTSYEVSGSVFDTAQNKGNFLKSFPGTSLPDTIAPWIVGATSGARQKAFGITFSEAMDTSFLKFFILPKKNLKVNWQSLRSCRFVPEVSADSLHYDTTYYLYLTREARDISGNTLGAFITSITPDTIYEPVILKGKVQLNDTLIKKGLAILERPDPAGIAFVEKGEFLFEVRDSNAYYIEVISGKYSGRGEVFVDSANIIILKLEEKNIDSIIN
jgi:hypothetical protein